MPSKISDALEDQIREAYAAGESTTSIAAKYGVTRVTVYNVARRAGIARSRTAEQLRRNSLRTPEERKALARAANEARRGSRDKVATKRQRAKTRQAKQLFIGRGEDVLAKLLRERGYEVMPQLALDVYNIDIALPKISVAVEVCLSNRTNPKARANDRRKIEQLLQRGWHVIYVMGDYRSDIDVRAATADAVDSFIEIAKGHPAQIREYWVIRCSGERLARSQTNRDHPPGVPASSDLVGTAPNAD